MADTVRLATAVRVVLLPAMEARMRRLAMVEAEVEGVLRAEEAGTSAGVAVVDAPVVEVAVTPVAAVGAAAEDTDNHLELAN